ncbi:MAG: 50S ribosomal protein L21 [Clostridia bacterium]|nr:50S ribosomal protein L21 [Clostridia bacterium]
MYAIIKTGGKQYKVQEGDVITVEKLDVEVGNKVGFDALLFSDGKTVTVGKPIVPGIRVLTEVVEHGKGDKLQIAVYKKMNGHHRAQGHRQPYTKLKVTSIK